MKAYADSNFFTRLYFPLPESHRAIALLEGLPNGHFLPISWLHRLEVRNAFELHVYQFQKGGQLPRISPELAAVAQGNFSDDLSRRQFIREVPSHLNEVTQISESLIQRHSATRGYRTYDLVHVAYALMLGCDSFWSFDKKANELAKCEGLITV